MNSFSNHLQMFSNSLKYVAWKAVQKKVLLLYNIISFIICQNALEIWQKTNLKVLLDLKY